MSNSTTSAKLLSAVGCAMMAGGVFAPFYKAPLLGKTPLMEASAPAGIAFIVLAVTGLWFALTDKGFLAWIAGLGGLILSAACIYEFVQKIRAIEEGFGKFFMGRLGSMLTERIELSWGIVVLGGGAFLCLAGASKIISAKTAAHKQARIAAKAAISRPAIEG